ncbi:MAG: phage tail protein [Chloroflexi bacterium]|nr:MAG: phage tail protein [Chloroflexota bacterium]
MAKGLPGLETDALAAYHFAIEIDGVEIAQFTELSGITSEIDVIDHKEVTALGKPVLHKVPGNHKAPTITLKRAKNASTDLWDWHQKVKDGKLSDARKSGSIVLHDYTGAEVGRYNFTAAWPSKMGIGTLKAGSNDILMEECTFVCEHIERVK